MAEEAGASRYELAYVLRDPAAEAALAALLAQEGAAREREERLREIQLAYPILKQRSGLFGSCRIRLAPGGVAKLKIALGREAGILRFLLVALGEERPGRGRAEPAKAPLQREAPQPAASPRPEPLSNEALEQKLEEILK